MGVDKKLNKEATKIIQKWKASRPDLAKRKEEIAHKENQKGMYVKFPNKLKVALQLLAVEEHMGYQTYLKMILADHVSKQIKLGKLSSEVIEITLEQMSQD